MRAVNSLASPNSETTGTQQPRLRTAFDYLPAIVAAIGLILLAVIADRFNNDSDQQTVRAHVVDELGSVRARLEGVIGTNAQLARGLAGLIAIEPDMSGDKFEKLAAQVMGGRSPIRNISAVPDLVVRYIYPREGNEAAIGFDLRSNPAQRDAALKIREVGEVVVGGPLELVQGGRAVVARAPVFLPAPPGGTERTFWGHLATVLDLDKVYHEAGLYDDSLQTEIAIRGVDGSGARGDIFYGRAQVFASNPVLAEVVLPYGSWQMAAIPSGGWPARPANQRLLQTAFWIAGVLIVVPLIGVGTLLGQRRRAEARLVQTLDELKEQTRAAEESEAKFAAAFEHTPMVATIARFDTGAILDVNDAFVRVTGIERYAAVGKNSAELDLYTPEQRIQFREIMQRDGKLSGQEIRVQMRHGEMVDVRIYSQMFAIDDTRYLLTLVEDITKRKEAERAAEAAQARLKNAIETVNDGFVLFDASDKLVTANSRYYRFFRDMGSPLVPGKSTFEDIMRTAASTGLYRAAVGRVEEYVAERLQMHRSGDHVFEQELVNGRWLRVTERRTTDGSTVCSAVDITEMKRREVELEQARFLADSANQAKSRFLSSMSHELRTPMNAILGFAQLMERGAALPAADKQKQYARHILNAGSYLLELIDQVLELSKIEAGKLSIARESVDVNEIIAHCLFMVTTRARRSDIRLDNRSESVNLPELWTDRARLRQILLNLLSNAIKYNREGGAVTVMAEMLDGVTLRITVDDTGSGIAKSYQGQIFEPFNRLGRETDGTEGSGIGLAISKQIAELLGGTIGFKSVEDVGSSFWVDLPVERPPDSAKPVAALPLEGPVVPSHANGQRRILYVEDNASNLELMAEIIDTVDHLTMVSAPSGPEALEMARAHKPDLILLDINLPEMDGFEVLRRLRAASDTRDIPVIALTAAAMPSEVEKGLQAGFREYITKPIDIATVLTAIDKHVS